MGQHRQPSTAFDLVHTYRGATLGRHLPCPSTILACLRIRARVQADSPYLTTVSRDGETDLLRTGAIRDGSMPLRDRRDGSCKLDVSRLQLPDAARQPHGELIISDGDEHTRAFDARHLYHCVSKPCRITE